MQHDIVERAQNLDSEILGSNFGKHHSSQETNESFNLSNPQSPHLQNEERSLILLCLQVFLRIKQDIVKLVNK